jgi:autotransporter-associated beta strand protein
MKFAVLFLQISFLFSTTAQWTGSTSANWDNSSNWNPSTAYPSTAGDIANLTGTAPAQTTLSLNGAAISLGKLNIDLGTGYTINGGGNFNFNTGGSSAATITITNTNGNGAHTINAPATLTNSLSITQNSTGTFSMGGVISGASSTPGVVIIGPQVVAFSGVNTYQGGTTITGGTLAVSADNNLGNAAGSVTISQGILLYTGDITTTRTLSLTGGAGIGVDSGHTVAVNSAVTGTGSLTKSGAGTLVLGTANSYSGGTNVSAGILSISSDTGLGDSSGSLNFVNGTLLTTSNVTSARSGSLSGTAVIDTNGNTDTFSGNFNGNGSLTLQGSGTVSLTGTNSYAGTTTIATGTKVIGSTASLPGNVTLNTSTSRVTFNQSFDGTSTGSFSSGVGGAGTVVKSGSGIVTFSGTSTGFSGTVSVNEGTLIVNGSLQNASSVNILSGATLGGAGTVGPVTNSGTLDPGSSTSSVGTLTINGALSLSPSSNLNMNVLPLSGDLIAASGAAALDGTLTVSPLSGFYAPSTCYTLLTAASFSGDFSSIVSSNSNFTISSHTKGATSYSVCIQSTRPFYNFPYTTKNNEAVGNNINALSLAGTLSADLLSVINTFAGKSFSSINDALSQMGPSQYSALTELQSEVDAQMISLFHRMPYLKCACYNRNRFWIEPFGNTLTLKSHGEQIGSQSNTGGVAFGLDREIFTNFILGFGGAWDYSFLSWHDHRGHGDLNGYYGALYADYRISDFYLGAALLGGADFYDTSRHLNFFTTDRHAKAHFHAVDIVAQLNTAYFFGSPVAYFYPYANFDFLYHETASFREHGADGLDLNIKKRTDSTLRTEMGLGLQLEDTNYNETMCISPLFSVGWVNMCPIQRQKYSAYFIGSGPVSFANYGWDETWNLISADFGLGFTYHCFTLNLRYRAEVSPDSETLLFNQYGNLRFDWKW